MNWLIAYYSFRGLPAALWLLNSFALRKRIHWLILWPVAIVGCYCVLILGVHLLDTQLEAELNKHDLDGDGAFSGAEITPAMEEAMSRLTNDTGRALAPITGIPFSIVWVAINYIPLGLISLVTWRYRSHRGDFDKADDFDSQPAVSVETSEDATNPYSPPRTTNRVE